MANPFKEAEKAKKKAPGSKHEHEPEVKEETVVPAAEPVVQEAPVVQPEVKPEPKVEDKVEDKPEEKKEKVAKPEKPAADIFAKLEAAKKPTGKAYTFYLSDDNVAKLKKTAEKKGISASKLLDHILSELL